MMAMVDCVEVGELECIFGSALVVPDILSIACDGVKPRLDIRWL